LVEDTPDDSCELFQRGVLAGPPVGRPILGTKPAWWLRPDDLARFFRRVYTPAQC